MIGRHKFSSGVADSSNTALVLASDWNAEVLLGYVLTNRTGGTLNAGDVVAIDPANDKSVILADVVGARRHYVVLVSAMPSASSHTPGTSVNNLDQGIFLPVGAVNTVAVAGATTRGNYLRKASASKALEDTGIAASLPAPADALAIALTGTGGAGSVSALFRGLPPSYNTEIYNNTFNGDMEIWGAGTSAVPTGWVLAGAGATVAKNTTAGQFKISTASAALTRSGTNCRIEQQIENIPGQGPAARWQGKTVTFGCWVRATVAGRARLSVADGVGETFSSYHSGGSAFEFLTVTRTIDGAGTAVNVRCWVDTGDTTAQFDGAVLVSGTSVSDFIPSGWRGRKCAFVFQASGARGGGVTHYVGTGHSSGTEVETGVIVPFKGVARNLHTHLSAAPGGSETSTATIRRDLNATALAVVVSAGSSEGANLTNEIEFTQNQLMTLQEVTSAGTASAIYKGAVEYEEIP